MLVTIIAVSGVCHLLIYILFCMYCFVFFLMIRRPPISTRTDTLFPYTTLFRSSLDRVDAVGELQRHEAVVHARHPQLIADEAWRRAAPVGAEIAGHWTTTGSSEQARQRRDKAADIARVGCNGVSAGT